MIKPQNRHAGRPLAGRMRHFYNFHIRIRPKSCPGAGKPTDGLDAMGCNTYTRVSNTRFWGRPEIFDLGGLRGPGGPGNLSKHVGGVAPHFWKRFPGPQGRPDSPLAARGELTGSLGLRFMLWPKEPPCVTILDWETMHGTVCSHDGGTRCTSFSGRPYEARSRRRESLEPWNHPARPLCLVFAVVGRFPWAPGRFSYPPGPILGSVFTCLNLATPMVSALAIRETPGDLKDRRGHKHRTKRQLGNTSTDQNGN